MEGHLQSYSSTYLPSLKFETKTTIHDKHPARFLKDLLLYCKSRNLIVVEKDQIAAAEAVQQSSRSQIVYYSEDTMEDGVGGSSPGAESATSDSTSPSYYTHPSSGRNVYRNTSIDEKPESSLNSGDHNGNHHHGVASPQRSVEKLRQAIRTKSLGSLLSDDGGLSGGGGASPDIGGGDVEDSSPDSNQLQPSSATATSPVRKLSPATAATSPLKSQLSWLSSERRNISGSSGTINRPSSSSSGGGGAAPSLSPTKDGAVLSSVNRRPGSAAAAAAAATDGSGGGGVGILAQRRHLRNSSSSETGGSTGNLELSSSFSRRASGEGTITRRTQFSRIDGGVSSTTTAAPAAPTTTINVNASSSSSKIITTSSEYPEPPMTPNTKAAFNFLEDDDDESGKKEDILAQSLPLEAFMLQTETTTIAMATTVPPTPPLVLATDEVHVGDVSPIQEGEGDGEKADTVFADSTAGGIPQSKPVIISPIIEIVGGGGGGGGGGALKPPSGRRRTSSPLNPNNYVMGTPVGEVLEVEEELTVHSPNELN